TLPTALAGAVACFGVIVLAGLPSERGAVILSNLVQVAAPAAAALLCLRAATRAVVPRHATGWRYLGASAASWALGQAIWTFHDLTGIGEVFPSPADLAYLAAVPLALVGVWTLAVRSTVSSWVLAVIDGLILAGGLLSISWPLLLSPRWEAGGESGF